MLPLQQRRCRARVEFEDFDAESQSIFKNLRGTAGTPGMTREIPTQFQWRAYGDIQCTILAHLSAISFKASFFVMYL